MVARTVRQNGHDLLVLLSGVWHVLWSCPTYVIYPFSSFPNRNSYCSYSLFPISVYLRWVGNGYNNPNAHRFQNLQVLYLAWPTGISPKDPELVSGYSSRWYFEKPFLKEEGIHLWLYVSSLHYVGSSWNFIYGNKSVCGRICSRQPWEDCNVWGVNHGTLHPAIEINSRWNPSQIHQTCLASFFWSLNEGFFFFDCNRKEQNLRAARR